MKKYQRNIVKLSKICDEVLNRMSSNEEKNPIQIVEEILKESVGNNRENLLRLKAQVKAWEKNTDSSVHLSIVAVVISIITFVITQFSEIVTTVLNPIPKTMLNAMVAVLIIYVFIAITYAMIVLKKIFKKMQQQKNYQYIIAGLEEYEKNMTSN